MLSGSKFNLVGYASGGSACWLRGEIVSTARGKLVRGDGHARHIHTYFIRFSRESEESCLKESHSLAKFQLLELKIPINVILLEVISSYFG